jgi:hypothetical protein
VRELVAGSFLRELWQGYEGEGVITLAGKGKTILGHTAIDDLSSWDEEDEDFVRDQDVWTFPSLRPVGIAPTKAGARHELVALAAFALDIDIDIEGHHASKKLPRSLEEAAPIIDAGPEPTHVVWTGGGVHLWWFFPPIPLPDQAARVRAQRVSEKFHEPFHAVAKKLDFHLDNTSGIERRFRLPGTMNTKGQP